MLFGPSVLLEYILGLQSIESTNRKTKETFQWPIIAESGMIRQNLLLIIQLVLSISLILLFSLFLCLPIEFDLLVYVKEPWCKHKQSTLKPSIFVNLLNYDTLNLYPILQYFWPSFIFLDVPSSLDILVVLPSRGLFWCL